MKYAGFWRRLFARMIDGIIIFIVSLIGYGFLYGLSLLFNITLDESAPIFIIISNLLFWLLTTLFPLVYSAYFVSKWGATPGKRLLSIEIRQITDENLNFWHAAGREIAMQINTFTLGISFIMIAARQDKRGLHDFVSRTQVIRY